MVGRTSITEEMWQESLRELGNSEFQTLDTYVAAGTAIRFKHSCGHVFTKTPHDWKRHPTCPECNPPGRKPGAAYQPKYTKEEVQRILDEVHGAGEVTLVSEYSSASATATFRHSCGHTWETRPNNVMRRRTASGCPVCANKKRALSHDEFLQRVADLPDASDYEVVGEYLGAHKGVDILHVSCGNIFRPSPVNFFAGTRCPACSSTTNSAHVRAVVAGLEVTLPFLGISTYAREHAFPDGPTTPNGSPLRYDLWIEELALAIEVDGEFHDRPHYADPDPEGTMRRLRASESLRHEYAERAGFAVARIRWDEPNLTGEAVRIVLERARELGYAAFTDFSA